MGLWLLDIGDADNFLQGNSILVRFPWRIIYFRKRAAKNQVRTEVYKLLSNQYYTEHSIRQLVSTVGKFTR